MVPPMLDLLHSGVHLKAFKFLFHMVSIVSRVAVCSSASLYNFHFYAWISQTHPAQHRSLMTIYWIVHPRLVTAVQVQTPEVFNWSSWTCVKSAEWNIAEAGRLRAERRVFCSFAVIRWRIFWKPRVNGHGCLWKPVQIFTKAQKPQETGTTRCNLCSTSCASFLRFYALGRATWSKDVPWHAEVLHLCALARLDTNTARTPSCWTSAAIIYCLINKATDRCTLPAEY